MCVCLSLSSFMKMESVSQLLSRVRLFATPRTAAFQAPLSMRFSSKNTGVGYPALLQGIFPTQGSNPGLLHCRRILYCLSPQGSLSSSPPFPPLPPQIPTGLLDCEKLNAFEYTPSYCKIPLHDSSSFSDGFPLASPLKSCPYLTLLK